LQNDRGSWPHLVRPVEATLRVSVRAWSGGGPRPWSGHQEKASGEQIEPRSAIHMPFQHLQPIDVPFDGALTPGQRDGGLDGGQVRPESSGEAPEGREGALGGAHQPWFKACGLALADEGGEVPRQCHRLRQFGHLRGQLRQLLVILLCQSS
jgi:hypothetical protein